jgi:hypothetical protein
MRIAAAAATMGSPSSGLFPQYREPYPIGIYRNISVFLAILQGTVSSV